MLMALIAEPVMADFLYLAVGILLTLSGVAGKPFAGAPEMPPTKEEIDSAKPPGRVARVFFIVLGVVVIVYSAHAIFVKLR